MALRHSLRNANVIARIGGYEFAAGLADTDDVTVVRDRLQRAVDERNLAAPHQVHMSIAVGYALFDPDEPEPLEVLVENADAAMYRMKRRTHSERRARTGQFVNSQPSSSLASPLPSGTSNGTAAHSGVRWM